MELIMNQSNRLAAGIDPWVTGKLGRDEAFVAKASPEKERSLDEALGLQMISIRLQKQLIEDLKFISTAHGIGYQPLIRDILSRFVVHEKKQIIREAMERRELEMAQEKQLAAEKSHEKRRRKAA
jgi:hypothetical protein